MRKRKKGRKLSRQRNQRKAFLGALITALFLREKIKTTEARAKEMAPMAEKYISRARVKGISSRRLLARRFASNVVKKLVEEIAPRYEERKGGYTRIIKLGSRRPNGAQMAVIELVK